MTLLDRSSTEAAAIMEVIERETYTFVDRDFDGWSQCWVQDDRTRLVSVSAVLGSTVIEGWPRLEAYMRQVFKEGMSCEIVSFDRTGVEISVEGSLAFVVFEGHSLHADGRAENTSETRVLTLRDGKWRIHYASFVLRGLQRDDDGRIAVDERGFVVSNQSAAVSQIAGHRFLRISHGRLRASRPTWDKVLQAGLNSAAEHHGFCQHYRHTSRTGKSFRLPLVLGETDDGGLAICTLFVRDGRTLIDLSNGNDLDDRMAMARAIFGLSDAQVALAHHIVSGDSLTLAAEFLGISINTARTHLSRVFEKTGVNSQTALVRTLLSIG
ncbi:MAG: helix-turn-helix transcriptional regulator [Pseudomonadota bacterium]